jgi:hypothetical protein
MEGALMIYTRRLNEVQEGPEYTSVFNPEAI